MPAWAAIIPPRLDARLCLNHTVITLVMSATDRRHTSHLIARVWGVSEVIHTHTYTTQTYNDAAKPWRESRQTAESREGRYRPTVHICDVYTLVNIIWCIINLV